MQLSFEAHRTIQGLKSATTLAMSNRSYPLPFVSSGILSVSSQGCRTDASVVACHDGAFGGGVVFLGVLDCEATSATRMCSKSIVLRDWGIDLLRSSC